MVPERLFKAVVERKKLLSEKNQSNEVPTGVEFEMELSGT